MKMNKEIKYRINNGKWAICRKPRTLPCKATGDCPYDYEKKPERDIEGMPAIVSEAQSKDSRCCPRYGHICPEFMEEYGFAPADLAIRSVIVRNMNFILEHHEKFGVTVDEVVEMNRERTKMCRKYPRSEYPEYYV